MIVLRQPEDKNEMACEEKNELFSVLILTKGKR